MLWFLVRKLNREMMGPIRSRGKQRPWGGSLPAVIKADQKMVAVVGEEWMRLSGRGRF